VLVSGYRLQRLWLKQQGFLEDGQQKKAFYLNKVGVLTYFFYGNDHAKLRQSYKAGLIINCIKT
jgi:hypothetical protein